MEVGEIKNKNIVGQLKYDNLYLLNDTNDIFQYKQINIYMWVMKK